MPKIVPLLGGVALLLVPVGVYAADSTVTVQGNGEGSTSHVVVRNSVSATANGETVRSSHTKITVQSNGQTKTYESDDDGDVDIRSGDGKAHVSVRSSTISTPRVTPTPSAVGDVRIVPTSASIPTPVPPPAKPHTDTFGETIARFFRKLFSALRF